MHRIAYLASRVLIAVIITAIVAVFVLTRLVPFVTGSQTVNINGNSMSPTIAYGSLAFVEPITEPKIGDIVTFVGGENGLVTHRIIDSWDGTGSLWLTAGDNNDAPDAMPVSTDAILGRVTSWVPILGIASSVLTTIPAMAFTFLAVLTLLYLVPKPLASSTRKVSLRSLVDLTDGG